MFALTVVVGTKPAPVTARVAPPHTLPLVKLTVVEGTVVEEMTTTLLHTDTSSEGADGRGWARGVAVMRSPMQASAGKQANRTRGGGM